MTDSSGMCWVDSRFFVYSASSQSQEGPILTPLDIDSEVVVCVDNRLVYQEYLSDCTSNADCGSQETCLAPPQWREHTGLRPSGYVSGTACASDAMAAKTFCLLDSSCTAVVAEYALSAPTFKEACLYHGPILPMDHSVNFTTFTKPLVQQIGHCVRYAMLEKPAPAPAALEETTKASLKRPTFQ